MRKGGILKRTSDLTKGSSAIHTKKDGGSKEKSEASKRKDKIGKSMDDASTKRQVDKAQDKAVKHISSKEKNSAMKAEKNSTNKMSKMKKSATSATSKISSQVKAKSMVLNKSKTNNADTALSTNDSLESTSKANSKADEALSSATKQQEDNMKTGNSTGTSKMDGFNEKNEAKIKNKVKDGPNSRSTSKSQKQRRNVATGHFQISVQKVLARRSDSTSVNSSTETKSTIKKTSETDNQSSSKETVASQQNTDGKNGITDDTSSKKGEKANSEGDDKEGTKRGDNEDGAESEDKSEQGKDADKGKESKEKAENENIRIKKKEKKSPQRIKLENAWAKIYRLHSNTCFQNGHILSPLHFAEIPLAKKLASAGAEHHSYCSGISKRWSLGIHRYPDPVLQKASNGGSSTYSGRSAVWL